MSPPPSLTESSASHLGFGHMHRSYGYLFDSIRSHHKGIVLFLPSVPSPKRSSVSLCQAYLILHLDFSVLDSRRYHRNRADMVDRITPWRESWKVHVKVVKLWYHKNPALDRSKNLLHMVLMDENLHKIQATIRDQLISNFAVSKRRGYVLDDAFYSCTKHWFEQSDETSVQTFVPIQDVCCFCGISKDTSFRLSWDHYWCLKRKRCGIKWEVDQSSSAGVRKERDVVSNGKLIKVVVLEVFTDGLFINFDIPESVEFLNRFSVASYGFSRLVTNELGYLVSKVDGDYFNPKQISNIQDLHANSGDTHYFLWMNQICDTTHVYVVTLLLSMRISTFVMLVVHVLNIYGIRVKIRHGGCAVLFVVLDNAATKLFGKTCSEAFLMIEEEFHVDPSVLAVCRSYSP
ncbi:hypothetical protein Ahy_A10g049766 isoform A [Arachis hypogaea]|uniref:Replication protein A 70 kDa DNA-binding subunit B/D first OB fold domain-containing protein n=1 Tax=Arachis hypogaea TaxID=3818 RepID=A0A445B7V6_ARAHY|nr:hypothetical protein Ahy_A10g049766 isoform A [Arachis hypogaea]